MIVRGACVLEMSANTPQIFFYLKITEKINSFNSNFCIALYIKANTSFVLQQNKLFVNINKNNFYKFMLNYFY